MKYGFIRVGAMSPTLALADCKKNAKEIIDSIKKAQEKDVSFLVFPELCVTGATCGSLFFQKQLQDTALMALSDILEETKKIPICFVLGLPFFWKNNLYSCAFVCLHGKILGIVPKRSFLSKSIAHTNYFASYDSCEVEFIDVFENQKAIPFGTHLIFENKAENGVTFSVEFEEELSTPFPLSSELVSEGIHCVLCLSSAFDIIGASEKKEIALQYHTQNLSLAYILANSGRGESSSDYVFAGKNYIVENGHIIAHNESFDTNLLVSEIDVEKILLSRQKKTWRKFSSCKRIAYELPITEYATLFRSFSASPFVPLENEIQEKRFSDITAMQAFSLAQRLKHVHAKSGIIGLSGGLDSTLALLVTVEAFKLLKMPLNEIIAITMPCFGTTDRTYNNALSLAKKLGVTLREIPIKEAVLQHFSDINHSVENHNMVYENAQARERTQILMDIANAENGLVVGTGDLSELVLGWATYNGDHMSMYGVNAGLPKTLIRHIVKWFAEKNPAIQDVLLDILDTPVSPELLPPSEGKIAQKTEDLVGPYELHDFFIYYALHYGFSPEKILFIAKIVFAEKYSEEVLKKWLASFYKRFFAQQFKRSCLPEGPKIGSVGISPRGDWQMPSDAFSSNWLVW